MILNLEGHGFIRIGERRLDTFPLDFFLTQHGNARAKELYDGVGNASESEDQESASIGGRRKIFVVHGHDDAMRETVARMLETLELVPIILHERPNLGRTIIEKVERNADVEFAVVLLSPDDQGSVIDDVEELPLRGRARQNVVLEFGYFLGKLGRERVCPIVKGELEIPGDIDGVVYLNFDDDSWRMDLVKELNGAGVDVDANKLISGS